ncbi:MAG: flagellar hook protein FlgE [Gemmatimonadota bacterium]|nr:flagellar hook protein FlgE [Gemmatimonadota bacterium]MDH5758232.1 flagellar hook protein FlgE [Gemmatimonadota bacterium]
MMRSLFAGVSGLRNHQIKMDVIGNNIANVNTTAYKASRVTFEEGFAQLLQGASRPPGDSGDVSGGVNPIQVGLGMNIGSIDLLFTQGNLESTGVGTDLAIQGEAFFVASDGTQNFFTRSGNFQLDANGRLVASTNGFVVQGRIATDGILSDAIQDIQLPFGQKSAARATTEVALAGNLDGADPIGSTRETTITVFDAIGDTHEMTLTFTKTSGTTWDYQASVTGGTVVSGDLGTLTFDNQGRLTDPIPVTPFVFTPTNGSVDTTVAMDFGASGSIAGLSQFAAPSTAVLKEQDGYTMGDLERFSIDQTGTVTGSFTNGVTLTLAQLVLADFNNPAGLIRSGDNMYQVSSNSGSPILGYPGEGSQSTITSGALEMSNVDLAQEFTQMITAQRGFQSNARVITTSDEMLQEVVSLKR